MASSSENPNWIYAGAHCWISWESVERRRHRDATYYTFRINLEIGRANAQHLPWRLCRHSLAVRQKLRTFSRWRCHFHFIPFGSMQASVRSHHDRVWIAIQTEYIAQVMTALSANRPGGLLSFAFYRLPHNNFVWFAIFIDASANVQRYWTISAFIRFACQIHVGHIRRQWTILINRLILSISITMSCQLFPIWWRSRCA